MTDTLAPIIILCPRCGGAGRAGAPVITDKPPNWIKCELCKGKSVVAQIQSSDGGVERQALADRVGNRGNAAATPHPVGVASDPSEAIAQNDQALVARETKQ